MQQSELNVVDTAVQKSQYIVYVDIDHHFGVEYVYEGEGSLANALGEAIDYHNYANYGDKSSAAETESVGSFIDWYNSDGEPPEITNVSVWDCNSDTDVWENGEFCDVLSLTTIEDLRSENLDLVFYQSLVENDATVGVQ